MIHAVATIEIAPGKRGQYLKLFAELAPKVHGADGCIDYAVTIDLESGIRRQIPVRENVVTVLEKWESLDALHAHLTAPYMAGFRKAVKGLVTGLDIQILTPVGA